MKLLLTTILSTLVLFTSESQAQESVEAECLTTHKVSLKNRKFVPNKLNVNVGDCIHFTNNDPMRHNVHSESDSEIQFEKSKTLNNGSTFMLAVEEAGTMNIFCSFHRRNMEMTVQVTEQQLTLSGPETPESKEAEALESVEAECLTRTVHEVSLEDAMFMPNTLDVNVGDCIKFTHNDKFLPHNVRPDPNSELTFKESRSLNNGSTFMLHVKEAGTMDIFCGFHRPMMTMTVNSSL